MRILSQDGLQIQDLPYEKTRVYIEKDGITVKGLLDGIIFELAKYSTEAKARKAMEMLRGAHISHTQFKIMTEVQRSVFLSSVSEKEQDNLYGLFRFPTDDEVEV